VRAQRKRSGSVAEAPPAHNAESKAAKAKQGTRRWPVRLVPALAVAIGCGGPSVSPVCRQVAFNVACVIIKYNGGRAAGLVPRYRALRVPPLLRRVAVWSVTVAWRRVGRERPQRHSLARATVGIYATMAIDVQEHGCWRPQTAASACGYRAPRPRPVHLRSSSVPCGR